MTERAFISVQNNKANTILSAFPHWGRRTAIAVDEVSRAVHEPPLQEPPSDEGGGLPKARRRERLGEERFGRGRFWGRFREGTEALPYKRVFG